MGEWISLSNDTIEHICILFITKITRFIDRNRSKKSYHLLRTISRYSQFPLISMTTNLQVVLFNPFFYPHEQQNIVTTIQEEVQNNVYER